MFLKSIPNISGGSSTLSKMILFGELTDGGMVEVSLSDDVVPKLEVVFKAKKEISKIQNVEEAHENPEDFKKTASTAS